MSWTETSKNAGGLIASLSLDMFVLRWLARFDTPERWARLLSEQADAYAHGRGMCIYDPVPFLHDPTVHALIVRPVGACVIAGLFCLGCVLCVLGESIQSKEGAQRIAQVDGDEIDD
jgi:hypothetical protein